MLFEMKTWAEELKFSNQNQFQGLQINAVQRITALWALSEATLGGMLHAFRIPFTGLFIGGSAIIFITLLATFASKKGTILRAMLIVMIVKALVSPHSPLPAYIAITFQGLMGELLFRFSPFFRLAALSLGLVALLQSALQKLLVLTIIFGKNLWESIDLFGNYILAQFLVEDQQLSLPISLFLIAVYITVHLIAGIISGLWAPFLARAVKDQLLRYHPSELGITERTSQHNNFRRPHRPWWKRISLLIFGAVAVAIIILSYIFPVFEKNEGSAALMMIIRSALILSLWFFILAPYLMTKFRSFLFKKKTFYAADIGEILTLFPAIKSIIKNSWKESKEFKSIQRFHRFSILSLTRLLSFQIKP